MSESFKLDYDAVVHLDAEDLAEQGIRDAYAKLQGELRRYGVKPEPVVEELDRAEGRYVVRCGAEVFVVYDDDVPVDDSWGRATYTLFTIVNHQLSPSPYRFYAVEGGNNLGGVFLTAEQADAARRSLVRKQDWPYIPTLEAPWFGQPQD